jgi:hypothetical protein
VTRRYRGTPRHLDGLPHRDRLRRRLVRRRRQPHPLRRRRLPRRRRSLRHPRLQRRRRNRPAGRWLANDSKLRRHTEEKLSRDSFRNNASSRHALPADVAIVRRHARLAGSSSLRVRRLRGDASVDFARQTGVSVPGSSRDGRYGASVSGAKTAEVSSRPGTSRHIPGTASRRNSPYVETSPPRPLSFRQARIFRGDRPCVRAARGGRAWQRPPVRANRTSGSVPGRIALDFRDRTPLPGGTTRRAASRRQRHEGSVA